MTPLELATDFVGFIVLILVIGCAMCLADALPVCWHSLRVAYRFVRAWCRAQRRLSYHIPP